MLDTNILIYLLEDIEPYAGKVESLLESFMRRENNGLISTINIAEVLTGFYLAGEDEKAAEAKSLLKDLTINGFEIAPVTFEIADLAARLRAKKGGKLPDAIIVATAIDHRADVIYSQDEDLARFSEEVKISKIR
ncbi:MAG: type II toxin-antitoxin system VapC family toxin [Candidatus Bathyarchaeia archaeon]